MICEASLVLFVQERKLTGSGQNDPWGGRHWVQARSKGRREAQGCLPLPPGHHALSAVGGSFEGVDQQRLSTQPGVQSLRSTATAAQDRAKGQKGRGHSSRLWSRLGLEVYRRVEVQTEIGAMFGLGLGLQQEKGGGGGGDGVGTPDVE